MLRFPKVPSTSASTHLSFPALVAKMPRVTPEDSGTVGCVGRCRAGGDGHGQGGVEEMDIHTRRSQRRRDKQNSSSGDNHYPSSPWGMPAPDL